MDHTCSDNLANLQFFSKTENNKKIFLYVIDINSKYTLIVPFQHSLLTIK